MTRLSCPRESEIWDAIAAGAWANAAGASLRAHAESCPNCRDVALVSSALLADASAMRIEDVPTAAAIVWWRAELRAKREARVRIERPITIVHALAIACTAGLALSLLGTVAAWLRGSSAWVIWIYDTMRGVTATLGAVQLSGPWQLLVWGSLAATLLLAPFALYVLFADE